MPLLLHSLLFLLSTSAIAAAPTFSDVPTDAWYTLAIQRLADAGFLNTGTGAFAPSRLATRAEFAKLTLAIGKIKHAPSPLLPSFDDVPKTAWYSDTMEDAAKENLLRGDRNCYGTHPCRAHPETPITRAQGAALLARTFGLDRKGTSPQFIDVGDSDWFAYAVYAAADRCILRGDPVTTRIRPQEPMNRAEMAVMFDRLMRVKKGIKICP